MHLSNENTAENIFRQVQDRLAGEYARSEARQLALILFDHFAGIDTKEMIINPGCTLERSTQEIIEQSVLRLLKHEPIQYITGIAHFCGYEFRVNPNVLIPRPETEELVRWILEDNANKNHQKIADIGTGSGCIAISLWLRFQDAEVHAFDFSDKALQVAVQNNYELGADVKFFHSDFLNVQEWPDEKYDIVVSNPPYIPEKNKKLLPVNVADYEPVSALFVPDHNPLIFYRKLAAFTGSRLKPKGRLYVEVHEHYADDVAELFNNSGFSDVSLNLDISGRKRMARIIN